MNADRADELVKEHIISLEIAPGVPTDEIALVRQIGMPPGSALSGVQRLVGEGWLERVNGGIQVPEDALASIFRQSFEVRSVPEGLCARLAAQRAAEEQLAAAERALTRHIQESQEIVMPQP